MTTQTSWTKDTNIELLKPRRSRMKFVAGGILLFAAVVYLIIIAMSGNTHIS